MTEQTICLEPEGQDVLLHIPSGLTDMVVEYLQDHGAEFEEIHENKKECLIECHESVEKTTQLISDYWLSMDRHCIIKSEGSQAHPDALIITPTENIPAPEE